MAATPPVRPTTIPGPGLASALYRLTVRQYDRMLDDGTIAEDERVELVEGLLVARASRTRPSIAAGNKALRVLWRTVPPGWHVAKGVPLVVSEWSKPEPELAVIRGEVEDYDGRDVLAADVALVVEIAASRRVPGLATERTDRARMYAASGIPVYWVVHPVEGEIAIASEPSRDGYQSHQVFGRGHDVPVVVAGIEAGWVAVADIVPRAE
jgi:Uma2 family endonuclease